MYLHLIRSTFLLFLCLSFGLSAHSQANTWEYYNQGSTVYRTASAVELPNGEILSALFTDGDGTLIRLDAQGNVLGSISTPEYPWLDLAVTSNNRIAGSWSRGAFSNGYQDSSGVSILDAQGNIAYNFAFPDTFETHRPKLAHVYPGPNGEVFAILTKFALKGPSLGGVRPLTKIVRLDSTGNPLLFIPTPYAGHDRFLTAGGITDDNLQFVAGLRGSPNPYTYTTDPSQTQGVFIQKLDASGQTVFDKVYLQGFPAHLGSAVQTADGGYMAAIDWLNIPGLRLMKFDAQGDSLWRTQLLRPGVSIRDMVALPDSGAVLAGSIEDSSSTFMRAYIARTDKHGVLLWENDILPLGPGLIGLHLDLLDDGGYLMSGQTDSVSAWVARLDSTGNLEEATISGQVYLDLNGNCQFDAGDAPWINGILSTTSPPYYTSTDQNGFYTFKTLPGNQFVSFNPPFYIQGYHPQGTCNNPLDSVLVNVPQSNSTVTGMDFPFDYDVPCPFVFVSQSDFFPLRPCSTSVATVSIANYTPMPIANPYAVITLDTLLTLDSASVPFTALGNNAFRFDFTSLNYYSAPGYSLTFMLHATVNCNAVVGEAICSELEGFPQDTCAQDSLWSGALVDVAGTCLNDTVQFTIGNVGSNAMPVATGILIAEDDILKHSFDIQFNVGEDTLIKIPGNGKTWTAIAQQVANSPSLGRTWSAIEGCNPTGPGSFSTGHVLTTLPAQSDPHHSVRCGTVRNSYDPNDKQGIPLGVGLDNAIAVGDAIEYRIRFQNTGNDPAYKVVIRDTLPPELDPATIVLGNSSHPFSFSFLPDQTMEWTFDPIVLPDSASDPTGSQGFVTFLIDQVTGNLPGTQIQNEASIFFDFNPAIITNISLHTLQETITDILLEIAEPVADQPKILAWPNPTTDIIHVRPADGHYQRLQLDVYDLQGRLIKAHRVEGASEVSMEIHDLPAGTYIFRLHSEAQPLGHGKIIVR